jgi:rubrerythrin
MTILVPTKATGATAKTAEMTYVEPAQQVTDDELAAVLPDTGLDMAFVADFLSAALTHERCGRHLYRSVAARTNNPVLKRRYETFGEETERHAEVLEDLIAGMGGNPSYVSPAARGVEGADTKLVESTSLLGGSLDVMTREMVMLQAVFLAECLDHAHWRTIAELADHLPDGDLRDRWARAVGEVEPEEDEHLEWAREAMEKMVVLQAASSTMTAVGAKAEELVETVRGWFS